MVACSGAGVSTRNNADWTALMLAALNGHEQVALVPRLVLLEAGADRNKELPGLSGWNALNSFGPFTAPSTV